MINFTLLIRWLIISSLYTTTYFLIPKENPILQTLYLERIQHLGLFILIDLCLYIIYHIILWNTSEKYKTLEYDQRSYVLKNLAKSTFLAFISIKMIPTVHQILVHGQWDDQMLKTSGNMYTATDITGLLTVPTLSSSTVMHHYIVSVIGIINNLCDYSNPGLHRAYVVMAYLSVLPYLVNTLLGLRYLEIKHKFITMTIPMMSVIMYTLSVICNISFQVSYLLFVSEKSIYQILAMTGNYSIQERIISICFNLLYLGAYYIILLDDIKLILYLEFKANIQIPLISPLLRSTQNLLKIKNQ